MVLRFLIITFVFVFLYTVALCQISKEQLESILTYDNIREWKLDSVKEKLSSISADNWILRFHKDGKEVVSIYTENDSIKRKILHWKLTLIQDGTGSNYMLTLSDNSSYQVLILKKKNKEYLELCTLPQKKNKLPIRKRYLFR